MTRRSRPTAPPAPACVPTGDLRPWVDERLRTCTLCAEIVTMRALADGSDWIAIDALGDACGREPLPDLCPCYPPDSGLRTRSGRIVGSGRGEIDEKPQHYGAGIPASAWFGGFHTHNGHGGETYFSDMSALPMACGHRLPPRVHTAWAEPLVTDRRPPECCGEPMRFAPRGWQCRPTRTYFTPDFESEHAHA